MRPYYWRIIMYDEGRGAVDSGRQRGNRSNVILMSNELKQSEPMEVMPIRLPRSLIDQATLRDERGFDFVGADHVSLRGEVV